MRCGAGSESLVPLANRTVVVSSSSSSSCRFIVGVVLVVVAHRRRRRAACSPLRPDGGTGSARRVSTTHRHPIIVTTYIRNTLPCNASRLRVRAGVRRPSTDDGLFFSLFSPSCPYLGPPHLSPGPPLLRPDLRPRRPTSSSAPSERFSLRAPASPAQTNRRRSNRNRPSKEHERTRLASASPPR